MKNQQEIDKKYLYNENKRLRLELRETKQLVKIQKESILKLSQPQMTQHSIISILLNLLSFSEQSSKIDKLNEKIISLQSHQMVLEKIVQQTDNDEKQTYHILAEQYNKIKQDNDKLQKQLHKFYEKIGEVDYLSGLVTKYKQVISPTDQAICFKKEQEQLLEFIGLQKQAIRKLTEQKNKLLKINIHMKQSVEKHKDQVRNMTMILNSPELLNMSLQNGNQAQTNQNLPSNILDELNEDEDRANGQNYSNVNSSTLNWEKASTGVNNSMLNMSSNRGLNTTINFIRMQRKIIKEQEEQNILDSEEESEQQYQCPELNILFPDKVEKIKKQKQITKVPYLNMMKIRQIMAKRNNKISKNQEQARHVNPTDKIIKLETQLQITRKQLTSQTLKFRTMSQELKSALKLIDQLQYRNQILAQSNQRLQTNYRNIYRDYQFTKIVALRVEKAINWNELENKQLLIKDISTSKQFDQKIKIVEATLKKMFGKRVVATRSQSLDK